MFADAKEEHAMRYTHHRGLARVERWVRLKFDAMNLNTDLLFSQKAVFFPHKKAGLRKFTSRSACYFTALSIL